MSTIGALFEKRIAADYAHETEVQRQMYFAGARDLIEHIRGSGWEGALTRLAQIADELSDERLAAIARARQ